MKILLYGLNYAPEITGIGKYTGELGSWLSQRGYDVRAVSAPPYYPGWALSSGYPNKFYKHEMSGVTVYRCPLYIPKRPSTLKRLTHLLSFVFSSSCTLVYLVRWRPDVVVNIVPGLFTSFPAWLYCKMTSAKLVIHVQDFESDAMFNLGMAKKGVLPKIWMGLERFVLSRADRVSTISRAMIENAIEKGVSRSKVVFFPNWSDVSRFKNVTGVEEFKRSMGFTSQDNVVLYSGNIGKKQGLELLVEVAQIAMKEGSDLVFAVVGQGVAKSDLIELANKLNLTNIHFFELQPNEDLPKLLAMAKVHLVIQRPSVADAVLPSKLTNILAVGGNSVITTNPDTDIGRLIEEFPGIAIAVEPENPQALLSGIKAACERDEINRNAMLYAEQFLAKESVLKKFEKTLTNIISV